MIAELLKVSKMNATLFSLNYYPSVLMQKYGCVCSVKLWHPFSQFEPQSLKMSVHGPETEGSLVL